jgi:phosphocarrier protein HPr
MIVKLLQPYKSSVTFTYKKTTINARSILGILLLAVKKNSHIIVDVEGEDASELLQVLQDAFDKGFEES